MVLEQGKCREFLRAVTPRGWTGMLPPDDLSPVTFLASARFWMRPEQSAWHGVERDLRRVLHGQQDFVLPRGPLPAGTELTGIERIDKCYTKQGSRGRMQFTETVTDFYEVPGRAAASLRATSILLAEAPTPGAVDDSPDAKQDPPADSRDPSGFTDLPWTVTDFVRYQGASGDFNPIHHDYDFASAGGYPGPFAVGMLTAGLAATVVGGSVDVRRIRRWTTRWKAQGWPGDAMTYVIRPGSHRAGIQLDVLRPAGRVHMQAWAELSEADP
jgi:hypothetical protein